MKSPGSILDGRRSPGDGGLADPYWHRYYTPAEVKEIIAHARPTTIVSGGYPIHVLLYEQSPDAPTICMAHGIFVYGLSLAGLALPFFRAGYNVVHWDLPGLGLSGGPRGGCTIPEFVEAWHAALAFTHERFGSPIFTLGVAEDGITCYYASANQAHVDAISVHALLEQGDYGGMRWLGPYWWTRVIALALRLGALARPSTTVDAEMIVPLNRVFEGPGDDAIIRLLREDPLALHRATLQMAHMLMRRHPAPVPFEACKTPVQVIASELNRIWPFEMVSANFDRLSCDKQLIRLDGVGQWEYSRDFHDAYAKHVMDWFAQHGGIRVRTD
jgi:alpha-beta hydrolase superfamily lysophospholipase